MKNSLGCLRLGESKLFSNQTLDSFDSQPVADLQVEESLQKPNRNNPAEGHRFN